MNNKTPPREAIIYKEFGNTFMDQYQLIFGENPDHTTMSGGRRFLYVAFTIFINIVNLNLLISIIGFFLDEFLMQ